MYAHKIDNKSQQHPVIAICLLMSKRRKTKCFILFFLFQFICHIWSELAYVYVYVYVFVYVFVWECLCIVYFEKKAHN